MRFYTLLFLLIISGCTCSNEPEKEKVPKIDESALEIPFNQKLWAVKEGKDYPYREKMLNNVIFNDSIRSLEKAALINVLGNPTREQDQFLYYLIHESKALFMTLKTRTLVIKLDEDNRVEWMKIHG